MLAVLVGVAWLASTVLDWGAEPQSTLYVVGLGLLVLSLASLGYALVATAPLWLRAVVTVATPALGYTVWLAVLDAVEANGAVFVTGAGMLVVGATGLIRALRRGSPSRRERPVHGRRAAR